MRRIDVRPFRLQSCVDAVRLCSGRPIRAIIPPVTGQRLNDKSDQAKGACIVGVEVGPTVIRAGVFASDLGLVGKTKFSTKRERGADGVFTRIVKCIRYAVDECDLAPAEIASIGIGVPGLVSEGTGLVQSAPQLGWQDFPLREQIEDAFGVSAAVANTHNLGAFGIYAHELNSGPKKFAAIFLGPEITGGLIANGRWESLAHHATGALPGATPDLNVFTVIGRPEFEHFRGRDFRKALRRGNEAVRAFAVEIASKAGEIAASLVISAAPEVIAIGGGILDEMREDVVRVVRETAERNLQAPWPQSTMLMASGLGDLAGITGAAAWAAQSRSRVSKEATVFS